MGSGTRRIDPSTRLRSLGMTPDRSLARDCSHALPPYRPTALPPIFTPMLLLLVRHARAGDRDPDRWADDSLRPLTNLGREIHSQVSRSLARLECSPEVVLTSPWVRAVQTAELMVEEMERELEAVRCEALAREVSIDEIVAQVQ